MDVHIKEYYCQFSNDSPNGHFHKVVALHESPDASWKEMHALAPNLSKGWFELSRLKTEDRIEFVRDFWLAKMAYHPNLSEFLMQFFGSLDDIGIFITQKMFDSPYEAHLVYSMKNDSGFFHGEPGATPQEIDQLQKLFPNYILPADYKVFLQIHNGFCKATDTGIIPTSLMFKAYETFQEMLRGQDQLLTPEGNAVDPKSLIPFYESFGLPCFHCFWGEWYPAQEMGNIYFSGLTNTISSCRSAEASPENLAFPTFTDWLMFYLEKFE